MTPASRAARGAQAERIVADYLVARGFTILGRNVRLGPLEIDVLAREGPVVAIVEVRTRAASSYQPALGSLSRTKQARLLRTADRLWQERFANQIGVDRVRIDVAAVYLDDQPPRVEYFEGAVSHG